MSLAKLPILTSRWLVGFHVVKYMVLFVFTQHAFSTQLQHVRVALVSDNSANFSLFQGQVLTAIREVNASEPGTPLLLGPVVLSSHPNPMDVYRQTCERLAGTDVSAVVVLANERTQFSLSVAGGFLGVPVIGLNNRAFAFSNKVCLHFVYYIREEKDVTVSAMVPPELFQPIGDIKENTYRHNNSVFN